MSGATDVQITHSNYMEFYRCLECDKQDEATVIRSNRAVCPNCGSSRYETFVARWRIETPKYSTLMDILSMFGWVPFSFALASWNVVRRDDQP